MMPIDPEYFWQLAEEEELLFMDGFDDAVIGLAVQFNKPVVLYDRNKCIQNLMDQGLSWENAEEYFSYNCEGAWLGEKTPAMFLQLDEKGVEEVIRKRKENGH